MLFVDLIAIQRSLRFQSTLDQLPMKPDEKQQEPVNR